MHTVILFAFLSLLLIFSLYNVYLKKFLPHHVCEHQTQHKCMLPVGTWCAGEFQYYTVQSCQFRLQWLLQTRCPIQQRRNALPPLQTGQDGTDTVPIQRGCKITLQGYIFTQPQWACLKDPFTGISNQTAVAL